MARTLTYYVAATLDGFIASPTNEFDQFLMEGDHMAALVGEFADTVPTHVHDLVGIRPTGERFDTVLMGWNTYAVGLQEGVNSPYRHLRQVVFSRQPREMPDEIDLMRHDPAGAVRALKAEEGSGIWLCGGGHLAATLYDEIDELLLKVNPVTFGTGIPLFGTGTYAPRQWERLSVRPFFSGVTFVHLRRM